MTSEASVLLALKNGIATVTLNRPHKCNALDNTVIKTLIEIFENIRTQKDCSVVILQAKGKHFCAGADIDWMQKMAKSSIAENKNDAQQLAVLMQAIYTFPQPVIVLMQGAVMGGGLGLVSVCDIAIAAADAKFAFSEVKLGISPSVISPYIVSVMGERAARYYFLTAKEFNVQEAQRLNLVQQIVTAAELKNAGEITAQQLMKFSPPALTATKTLTREVSGHKISEKIIDFTVQHLMDGRMSEHAREGLAAFLEKRSPQWS